ncbi:hypothetical protein D3H65_18735 [Paraflavitalea soli]|uniref:Auto-transporter adhesin head GIN domain-containing protein n=1 Tax=Paraflavitalea soli TaxID=2315862 RepID=A0A3B7MS80_9BACT|nr:hypothetical protein [Paraflavitalea soli]AXY75890.1 hypothetical protein D3H65_18735 [Paraflavitalea soli]
MKKYTIFLLIALTTCCATSFAQTIVVTELKRPIESASEVKFDASEITLTNVKINCETLLITSVVTKINIIGSVEITCKKLVVPAATSVEIVKSGPNEATFTVLYGAYANNTLTLKAGAGEVQITCKKK